MSSNGYHLEIKPLDGNVDALLAGNLIATSSNAKIMHETRLNDCYYFPKSAIEPNLISPSDYRTFCPFKGTASYWNVQTPNGIIENGAWSYEAPLQESEQVGGMLSFSKTVVDDYRFENEPEVINAANEHISSALSDWILREAGYCSSRRELVQLLGQKFVEAGIAVYRLNIIIRSLHPEIAVVNYVWNREKDSVEITQGDYEIFNRPEYINSPINLVAKGLGGVRQPLNGKDTEFDFPIMDELKAEGATDYVAMPLRFSDGQFHTMTMACDHELGFTTENLGLVFECAGVISRYFEVMTLRKNTSTLMDTYLGKRTGEKVLSGDIRRGQGEDIQAVILFSDLRNSTGMAGELSRQQYLQTLNYYFETVLTPLGRHDGEVLKFIGDAVLAIFPISENSADLSKRAGDALLAAQEAVASLEKQMDTGPSAPVPIDLGISLHIGEVTYGNVGGKNRLDFTVIGPAVNLASRLESLCKTSGNRILLSQDFNAALNVDIAPETRSLGFHNFAGIPDPQEVFALEDK